MKGQIYTKPNIIINQNYQQHQRKLRWFSCCSTADYISNVLATNKKTQKKQHKNKAALSQYPWLFA